MNIVQTAIAHAESKQTATKDTEWTVYFGHDEYRTGRLVAVTAELFYVESNPQAYFPADKVIFLYPNT